MAMIVADTASIDPRAQIDDEVEIGPYCVVGPDVRIGRGTRLISHVSIMGNTTIGQHNLISPFAVIGGDPQDHSYRNTPTIVEIGDHNIIREGVTINRGTEKEDGITRVGSHNFLMANAHIAHDCKVGDHITITNNTMVAGHCHIHSYASISGGVAVHHFVTVGGYCFVGGQSRIYHDVPPYMLVEGNPSKVRCINIVGLRRRNISKQGIEALHEAHRLIYRAKMKMTEARTILQAHGQWTPEVERLLEFVDSQQLGRHGRARERFRTAAPASHEQEEG